MRLSSLVFVLVFVAATHVRISSMPPQDVDPLCYTSYGRRVAAAPRVSRFQTLLDFLTNRVNPKDAVFFLSEEGNSIQLRYEGSVGGRRFSSNVQELYERKQMVQAFLPGSDSTSFLVVGTTDEARVKALVGQVHAAAQGARESVVRRRLQVSCRLIAGGARVHANGSLSPRGQ